MLITYATLLALVMVAQIIAAILAFQTANDQQKVTDFATGAWQTMPLDLKNKFQSSFSCCGFRTAFDRPGDNCATLFNPCRDEMERELTAGLRSSAIYLLVTAGSQLFGILLATILAMDERKRVQGYGQGW